ncbi:unnamed protein product [Prunus brigantina]
MKKQRDRRTAETIGVVLNSFLVQLSLGGPHSRLELAVRKACVFQKLYELDFGLVNDVECLKKPISHGITMSFTRDAILFESRVHGPNSEVRAKIYGLPDLSLHARRSSSSAIASSINPTSPREDRLQLTGHRKGTKKKNSRTDALPKLLGLFLTHFLFSGPHSRLDPAVWQACAWHKVRVATLRPDSPHHSMRRHAISLGGALNSQPVVMWHRSNVAHIHSDVIS